MKKVVCVVLVALMCIGTSFAEKLNLKSDQELIAMYQEIQAILLSRSQEYVLELNAGTYTVGSDVPAGEYRVECPGAYSSAIVKLYSKSGDAFPASSYTLAELYNSSVIGKLVLEKGNVLSVSGSKVELRDYNVANTALKSGNAVIENQTQNQAGDKEEFTLASGKYKVGDEIPTGTYRVAIDDPYGMVVLDVFDSAKSLRPSYSTILSKLIGNGEIGKLVLEKGNIIQIAEGSVTFYEYTGIK